MDEETTFYVQFVSRIGQVTISNKGRTNPLMAAFELIAEYGNEGEYNFDLPIPNGGYQRVQVFIGAPAD